MASVLRATLPRRNNYAPVNYSDLLEEGRAFGVITRKQLRRLILKHRRSVISADRGPFDTRSAKAMRAELGDHAFNDFSRRQLFWTWEGLFRLAMECEYGERYVEYLQAQNAPSTSLERTRGT